MIICWDNIENLIFTKKKNLRSKNRKRFYYFKICENCKAEFLGSHKQSEFCSNKCSNSGKYNGMFGKPNKTNLGTKRSEETKRKMRLAQLGKKNHFFNKKHTDETKRKIIKNHDTNRKEVRNKISKTLGDGRLSGSRNPSWRGGISKEGYCFLWRDSEFKKLIRDRDDYICINCGATKDLVIHHINYNKLNCEAHNLITICRSCNGKANFNRKKHTLFYQKIMTKKYGYQYENSQC